MSYRRTNDASGLEVEPSTAGATGGGDHGKERATMGWWQTTQDGQSTPGATGLIWGDEVADIMDEALRQIWAAYKHEWGRPPMPNEIKAGLEFSLGGLEP